MSVHPTLRTALSPLAWLGRMGTRAVAISAVLGLMLPFASALVRPVLEPTIFLILILAYLRVDMQQLRRRLARPGLVLASLAWMMVLLPMAAAGALYWSGLAQTTPALVVILFIALMSPPVMSAPAFAFLMGLDGTLSITVLVLCIIAVPLTAPVLLQTFFQAGLQVDALDLSIRLFWLLAGSFVISVLLRKLAGARRLAALSQEIDGLNVVLLFIFALAAMDGVAAGFLANPVKLLLITAATFVVAFVQMALTMLFLWPANRADAFTIALATGNRNMGIMVASLGGTVPELAWFYFALGQFPIYCLPLILQPLARRFVAPAG